MDAAALAGVGTDALAPLREKAWAAVCEWIKWRCTRQRGVHIPNLLQIYWLVSSSDGTSKLKRPVFVLSPRFTENYGVHPSQLPPGTVPAPATGDDINFYHLAIQFSNGLSKDQAFVATRDMLFRLGEAAKEGRELRIELGAGTLSVADRTATFDWAPGFGGSAPVGERKKGTSSLDPLSGRARTDGDALSGLQLGGVGAGRSALQGSHCGGGGSALNSALLGGGSRLGGGGSRLGGGSLTAEEEAQLFRELDSLDPEERAAAEAAAGMRAADLEQPTKAEVARLLKLSDGELDEQTVEELGDALAAKVGARPSARTLIPHPSSFTFNPPPSSLILHLQPSTSSLILHLQPSPSTRTLDPNPRTLILHPANPPPSPL